MQLRVLAQGCRARQLRLAPFRYSRLVNCNPLRLEALGDGAGLLVGHLVEDGAAARIRLRIVVGLICDRSLLYGGLACVKHWRITDQGRIRCDRRRRARPPDLALPVPQPAGHDIESRSPIGPADQFEVPLGQAQAPHQRHEPGGKTEEARLPPWQGRVIGAGNEHPWLGRRRCEHY